MTITRDELIRLIDLEAKATPGEWNPYAVEGPFPSHHDERRQQHSVCIGDVGDENHECVVAGVGEDEERAVRNAVFISEIRNKAKALLDAAACHDGQCSAVGELRAMVEAYRKMKTERAALTQVLIEIYEHIFADLPEERAPLGNRLQIVAAKIQLALPPELLAQNNADDL